jgi:hypothetical protein
MSTAQTSQRGASTDTAKETNLVVEASLEDVAGDTYRRDLSSGMDALVGSIKSHGTGHGLLHSIEGSKAADSRGECIGELQ